MGSSKRIDWSKVPDLGVSTDTEIAARLGVTGAAVCIARKRLGIPAPGKHMRIGLLLSGRDLARLTRYADKHGVTREQAVSLVIAGFLAGQQADDAATSEAPRG